MIILIKYHRIAVMLHHCYRGPSFIAVSYQAAQFSYQAAQFSHWHHHTYCWLHISWNWRYICDCCMFLATSCGFLKNYPNHKQPQHPGSKSKWLSRFPGNNAAHSRARQNPFNAVQNIFLNLYTQQHLYLRVMKQQQQQNQQKKN